MRTAVKKWGNSASVRIPAAIMEATHLNLDEAVDMREESGRIVIEPAQRKEYDLTELVKGITRENLHDEPDFGKPAGKGDRLQIVPLFRSCAPNQICLCSTSKKPRLFLGARVSTFVEIVNEPGSLSGLVGQMTVRGRLDRVDGSTSHPMLHLGVLRDRIHFLSYAPKTDLHLRHGRLSVPKPV